jgi:hypothetical protein
MRQRNKDMEHCGRPRGGEAMSFKNVLPALAEISKRAKPARDEKSRRLPKPVTVGAGLHWRRIGTAWRLFDGRHRFGEIVPDGTYPNMWRPVLAGGRLGDMANITWAKHAVLEAAVRELEWEGRRNRATDPSKCPENRGVFKAARPHSRSDEREATYPAPNTLERPS